jgi:single-strand DNA-binding protein
MAEIPDERCADDDGIDSPELVDHNQARLVGRLSGAPNRRTLPSGDEIVSLRMVVRRPGGGSDTLPVQFGPAPAAGSRRRVGQVGRRALAAVDRLEDGTRIEVLGAVRRRWWAGPDGRRSRIEVLAQVVRPATDPMG